MSKEQCSSSSKKKKLQKKPQVKVPNKKKAETKYKPRNNSNNNKNSYYGPSMNSKAKFPRRNSRDEFGRMPQKKEGNTRGPKKNAGQDHQVQASLGGGASSSQAFKQTVEKAEKALPIKWEPPAPKQQSCLHYENDGAI